MKRLVFCCDGTWSTGGQPFATNVSKFAREVAPAGPDGVVQQMTYRCGVGAGRWERVRGGAFGFGLSRVVRDIYGVLVATFTPGDELYFLGFSRGAYTARSVVGLVRNCGVLRPEHADRLGEAYALYRRRDGASAPDAGEAAQFRERWSHPGATPIRFIGVWDTVGALGIPLSGLRLVNLFNRRWQFHDTRLSSTVGTACQALAIDEKRGAFEPTVWRPPEDGAGTRLQVWFAGDHGDVGGGHPDHGLSDIALRWIAAWAQECGLVFAADSPLLPEARPPSSPRIGPVHPDPLAPVHDSFTGLYRLMPQYPRPIGKVDAAAEAVASSACERMDSPLHGYRPENVRTYLASPDQRVEPALGPT